MPTPTARRTQGSAAATDATSPVVIYVAGSLDGTTFALDPASQLELRKRFPDVRVTTRRIFISHDTHEAFNESLGRFEDQIAVLLTGVQASELIKAFGSVSFRNPQSEAEVGRLPAAPQPPPKRAGRRL